MLFDISHLIFHLEETNRKKNLSHDKNMMYYYTIYIH